MDSKVRLSSLFLTFLKIGAFTFGGGYAMISIIGHECVEKNKWMTSDELMDMTVVAESTPGPVAINCATYVGYKARGFIGALLTTLGVVLPSFFIILLISFFFEKLLSHEAVIKAFAGIRVAVSVLIMQTALKMIHKMIKKTHEKLFSISLVVLFFTVVFVLNLLGISFSTIYLIIIAGIIAYVRYAVKRQNGGSK